MSDMEEEPEVSSQDEQDEEETPSRRPKPTADEKKAEGNAKFVEKDWRGAIESYSDAIELNNKDPALYSNRAAAYLNILNCSAALKDCEKAIALDPTFIKAYVRGAKAKMHKGDFNGATELLNTIKNRPEGKRDPTITKELKLVEEVRARLATLTSSIRDEKWDQALSELEFVNTHMGDCEQVQILACETLIGQGLFSKANSLASKLYRVNPSNPAIMTIRAIAAYYTQQVDSAMKLFRQVLDQDPDNRKCHKYFKLVRLLEKKKEEGNAFFKVGKNQEAIDAYTEALTVDPANKEYNAILLGNRAAALLKLKQPIPALRDCEKALELKSDYTKIILRKAQILTDLERYQDAVRDLENASKNDPQNAEIAKQLRQAQVELKKSKRKNYYKILEVQKNADTATIKRTYRKLALLHHPDKNNETPEAHKTAEAKFKDIQEAYDVLSDDAKRAKYDRGDDIEDLGGGGGDPSEMFQHFFRGGGGGGGHGGHSFHFG